ncbi:hypothetical protein [Devosia aquimaris]|nr:hypothetical protein [Devosia sp. CJK-A8-3]
MMGWFRKALAAKPAARPATSPRQVSPENCALWRDVTRALDAKPKGLSK